MENLEDLLLELEFPVLLDLEFEGLPPTVNHIYRGAKGWRYLTQETREFQERITTLLREQWQDKEAFTGPVFLSIFFYIGDKRRRDIDNHIKALQDCFEKAGVIQDDSQIYAIFTKREDIQGKKNYTKLLLREWHINTVYNQE